MKRAPNLTLKDDAKEDKGNNIIRAKYTFSVETCVFKSILVLPLTLQKLVITIRVHMFEQMYNFADRRTRLWQSENLVTCIVVPVVIR